MGLRTAWTRPVPLVDLMEPVDPVDLADVAEPADPVELADLGPVRPP